MFGKFVTTTLLCDHVQKHGAWDCLKISQYIDQGVDVVSINRAVVVKPQCFKQTAGHDHAFNVFFGPACEFKHARNPLQHPFTAFPGTRDQFTAEYLREVFIQRADVRRDRHVVIIEYHEHIELFSTSMVQGFKGHAGGHSAITNNCHDFFIAALCPRCQRHASGCTD